MGKKPRAADTLASVNTASRAPKTQSRPAAPLTVRLAAIIATLQSVAVLAFGTFLAVRTFTHAENQSMVTTGKTAQYVGVGTAVFLFICFGFVIAGAVAMVRGKRWGRGAVVLAELILTACSFQMFNGGAPVLGAVTLASCVAALYLLMFRPESARWAEQNF